jgi:hypothetical protein
MKLLAKQQKEGKKKTSGPPPSETELTGTAPDNVEKLPQEKKLP